MTRTFEDDPDFDAGVVNDGFCSRPYDYRTDGWMQHQTGPGEYPVLDMATQILEMGREINFLRRRLWEAESRLEQRDEILFGKGPSK